MFKNDDDDDEYFLIISCDLGLHSYTGNVSLPFTSDKPATHALVFILHAITTIPHHGNRQLHIISLLMRHLEIFYGRLLI